MHTVGIELRTLARLFGGVSLHHLSLWYWEQRHSTLQQLSGAKKTNLSHSGHSGLYCCASGFVISEEYPLLVASPDAAVYDPSCNNPFGLAEVKCPYSCCFVTPTEACSHPNFCCTLVTTSGCRCNLKLRTNHLYYARAQVQGQMGVTQGSGVILLSTLRRDSILKGFHSIKSIGRKNLSPLFW